MSRLTTLASLLLCAATLTACGEDTSEATQDTTTSAPRGEALKVCSYEDFSVEVTAGPNAGTQIAGRLTVFEREDKTFTGTVDDGTEELPVSGRYGSNQRISLSVEVGDGYVVGVGPLMGDLCSDGEAEIEGVATGPALAADNTIEGTDTGHWLLRGLSLGQVVQFDGTLTTFDVDTGLSGSEGGGGTVEVRINIPDSVVANCTNPNTNRISETCLQNFCTGQLAGQVVSPDAGMQMYACSGRD